MLVIYRGIDSIRVLLNIKAPLLIALGLALLAWAYRQADGFGPMLTQPSQFAPGGPKAGQFWAFFFPALTGDDRLLGDALAQHPRLLALRLLPARPGRSARRSGLPTTMAPVLVHRRGRHLGDGRRSTARRSGTRSSCWRGSATRWCWSLAMVSLCLATLATNIAANVVGPANDFAHLWPRRISFRTGGLITGVIGILIQPWKLIADPSGYIFKWLVAYSALLGAIGGHPDRRLLPDPPDAARPAGPLPTGRAPTGTPAGFNPAAMIALVAGIAPCVPGFLGTVGVDRGRTDLDGPVQLRLVPQLRRSFARLRGPDGDGGRPEIRRGASASHLSDYVMQRVRI